MHYSTNRREDQGLVAMPSETTALTHAAILPFSGRARENARLLDASATSPLKKPDPLMLTGTDPASAQC